MKSAVGSIALCAAVLLTACSGDRILLVIDSDLQASEMALIQVTAGSPGAATVDTNLPPTPLPATLLIERDGSRSADVRIHVSAMDDMQAPVVQRIVETRFDGSRTLHLEIPLGRDCVGNELCEASDDMTCLEGRCVAFDVDPGDLPDGDPGATPMPLFDGPSEPDAGVTDAGMACVPGAPCEPGDPCRVGEMRCDDVPSCESVDNVPAGTPCGMGRMCDGEGTCGRRD